MPIRHTVEEGDSVVKLAAQHGFFPATIWNDGGNAELKSLRKDMNILAPGDTVVVPDLRDKAIPCATHIRHVFRRRGVPMIFRLQLFVWNEPRKNQPWTLEVDGVRHSGTTTADGRIELYLPNTSTSGQLNINNGEVEIPILFGYMDPVSEVQGVKKRLVNLGFDCGELDEELNPQTKSSLRQFQSLVNLKPTGEIDGDTRDALANCHDMPSLLKQRVDACKAAMPSGAA
ncbi:MAG TPA: peptidoglycan-binding protein [Bryobacteraceae bacterium]|jgi:N-acetylmuramoyl-L-alanine amidase